MVAAMRQGRAAMTGLQRRHLLGWPLVMIAAGRGAAAHNNPTFTLVPQATIAVADGRSAPFALDPPKRSVELVWRCDADATFKLVKGEEVLLDALADGSVTKVVRGTELALVADTGMTVEILANVAGWAGASG
jgi:hypothetical protein